MLATQSPRVPLATETGERCFIRPIDQLGVTVIFTTYAKCFLKKRDFGLIDYI